MHYDLFAAFHSHYSTLHLPFLATQSPNDPKTQKFSVIALESLDLLVILLQPLVIYYTRECGRYDFGSSMAMLKPRMRSLEP